MEPGVVMECETDAPRCGGFNGQKLLLHLKCAILIKGPPIPSNKQKTFYNNLSPKQI